jgi:YegS/Rv2252/BmrU family lipid kinase
MSETVIVLNPNSGSGDHVRSIRDRAELRGDRVKLTEEAGDAITLAQEVAEAGTSTIVAAGGDGTVNEVVQGIDRADAFADVTLGILPVGTGNNFAKNVGITDLDSAFAILEDGKRRKIDIGEATDRLFLNSCVAGLTAQSSSQTSPEMKSRLGVLAYVITTLRSVSDFDTLPLSVDIEGGESETTEWTGDAICILVGNGRRFTTSGSSQANMEDGLLEVTIIEDVSTLDLMSNTLVKRLLGEDSPHIARMRASKLTIAIRKPESIQYSLDGEIIQQRQLSLDVRPRTLTLAVGDTYAPNPD